MQQTVLIIGGTSGLGRKLAELYCSEGSRVGIVGRRKQLLEEISAQFPIQTLQLDISAADCTSELYLFIEQLGDIDKIIIAASIVEFNPSLSYAIEERTIAVNVYGYMSVINNAYHYFLKRRKGHLTSITSIAAARGNKTAPAYNASKAFQSSYLEGIRLKFLQENKNIHVTEIIPGYMDTQMAKGERLFWMCSINKAAQQTKKAIDLKKRRAFVSRRWIIIYKIYRYLPSFLYTYLINSTIKLKQKH
jgi:short-subunit dehydrogenase